MKKIIYCDIDETICEKCYGGDYTNTFPYKDRIKKMNKLYNKGYTIIYWTARGSTTGIDWEEITKKQLKKWGCKYTKLLMNKPYYDIWIDDKAFNSNTFFEELK